MSITAQNIADKPIKVEFQTMIIRSKQVEKKELMISAKNRVLFKEHGYRNKNVKWRHSYLNGDLKYNSEEGNRHESIR